MAATVKKEYILKVMEEQNLPYYAVTDGKDMIGLNDDEPNIDAAVRSLEMLLDNVEDGFVVVKLSNVSKKDKGAKGGRNYWNFEFKLNLKKQNEAGIGAAGINSTILQLMEANNTLLRKIEQQANEQKIKELERAIGEAKEEGTGIEKWIPVLTAAMSGQKVGLAGTGAPAMEPPQVDRIVKIRAAIARLGKVDRNIDDTLTLLADFAEEKPEQYLSFIPIIKSQLNK